jgi:Bacterial Ig-like domain
MKKILPLFIIGFLLFSMALPIRAAGLTLNKIGTDITEGKTFSEWTYVGINPEFIGESAAGATVEVKVDDVSYEVIADVNGNWTWQPTALAEGDHDITVKSDGEFIYFTLHLTSEDTSSATSSATTATTSATTATTSATTAGKGGLTDTTEALPQSGAFEMTVLLIASGMTLIGFGMVMKEKFSI